MSDQLTTGPGSQSKTDATKAAAKDTAGTAVDQTKAVAGTAGEQAADVAADAKAQLGTVTAEARDQARKVMSSATSDMESQLGDRLTRAAAAARSTATELQALAEGRTDEAGRTLDFARQASERLEHFAERADELGVRGMAEEVSDFARRRPAAFLLGAVAAGVLVGRLARAGKEASSSGSDEQQGYAGPTIVPSAPALSGTAVIPPEAGVAGAAGPAPVTTGVVTPAPGSATGVPTATVVDEASPVTGPGQVR